MNHFSARSKINLLEDVARQNTCIHRLNPFTKLLCTVCYLITVVSFPASQPGQLLLFIFYPAVLLPLAEIPFRLFFQRLLIALPFCLFGGLSNLLNTAPAFLLGSFLVTQGALACVCILLKTLFCVCAVLLLVATTPLEELAATLRRCHIPAVFVLLLLMTYRYISLLIGEAGKMYTAYRLRSELSSGIAFRDCGAFVGSLLLRSFDRAERVWAALQCRSAGIGALPPPAPYRLQDFFCLPFLLLFCGLAYFL